MSKEDLSKAIIATAIVRDHQGTTVCHTGKGGLVLKIPSTSTLKTQERNKKSKMSG